MKTNERHTMNKINSTFATDNLHADDEVLFERRVPASQVKVNEPRKGVPELGSVAFYDSFDEHGNLVEGVPLHDGGRLPRLLVNDIISSDDGFTHVFRGNYWIDEVVVEDGEEIAVLHLGSMIRCEHYGWCGGHHMADNNGFTVEDSSLHMSEAEMVCTFDRYEIKVYRTATDGLEGFTVYLDTNERVSDGFHDLAALEILATQIEDAATHVRKFAAAQVDNN